VDNCGMVTCNRREWTSVNWKHKISSHDTRNAPVVVGICVRQQDSSIARLCPQSLRRFVWILLSLVWHTNGPPTPQSRACSCLVSRQILEPPSLWIQTDMREHVFAQSFDLWEQFRQANATCVWSWRLCWVIRAIRLHWNWSYYMWRK
jgi:hypothetical protein